MKKYLEYIWLILVVLSIFAYVLGYLEYISTSFVAILLVTTFIKGELISDYFMGLKNVRLIYRLVPIIWLGITVLLIAVAYYLPIN